MTMLITLALAILNVAALPLELRTPQLPDLLVIDGVEYRLHTNPLEVVFEDNPDLRPNTGFWSSNNWRGYVAEWTIVDNKFILTDIKANMGRAEMSSVFDDVFPGLEELLADWYSGHLILPVGELVDYIHLDYASRYSHYMIITIIDGLVVQQRDLSLIEFDEFRNHQFELYKATDEYHAVLEELSDEYAEELDLESFLFDVMTGVYTSIVFEDN